MAEREVPEIGHLAGSGVPAHVAAAWDYYLYPAPVRTAAGQRNPGVDRDKRLESVFADGSPEYIL